jgi:hypothetical protein
VSTTESIGGNQTSTINNNIFDFFGSGQQPNTNIIPNNQNTFQGFDFGVSNSNSNSNMNIFDFGASNNNYNANIFNNNMINFGTNNNTNKKQQTNTNLFDFSSSNKNINSINKKIILFI